MAEDHEPTDEEILASMRPETRRMFDSPDLSPQQRAQMWQGAKKRYRAAQKPQFPQSELATRGTPEIDWTQTREPRKREGAVNLSALQDEVNRAGKVMGQATELLKHRTPTPLSDDSADKKLPHSEDKRHTEFLWAATGVVVTILALVVWGFLFVFAWGLYAVGVYKAPWFSSEPEHVRFAKKGVIDALIAFGLLAVWWFVPVPDFAKPKEVKTNTASTSPSRTPFQLLASPTPTPMAISSPSPSNAATDVPQTVLKQIPFKGGSPQRLDKLMRAAGYTGPTVMAVLYVRSSDTNETEVIVGTRPDLTAKNSRVLEGGGDWVPFERGEDTARIYVLAPKNSKIDVTFKPK